MIAALLSSSLVPYIAGGAVLLLSALFGVKSLKSSGAADQQALDARKGAQDNATAAKVRSADDGLSSSAVDQRMQQYERK